MGVILQSTDRFSMWVLIWVTYGYMGHITPTWGKYTHVIRGTDNNDFYAPQLYRQVLLRRVLAMGILSVCPSVCHNPVVYQAQMR